MSYNNDNTYKLKSVNRYHGSQVIINSDRLVFNAKEDSILFYANESLGFSVKGGIYFDTSDIDTGRNPSRFTVNSPKIYLGLDSDLDGNKVLPSDRVVLGNQLRSFLGDLIRELEQLLIDLFTNYAVTVGGDTSAPCNDNLLWMNSTFDRLTSLRKQIAVDPVNKVDLKSPDNCAFLSQKVKIANNQ